MKITYRHYRVPAANWKRKGDPPKKGDPPNLARYMRGVTKWTPHGQGGRTFCTILDDDEKVIALGGVTCFMEDNFCYREGRERALQNALENMAEERGERMMNNYIAGLTNCNFSHPLHWSTSPPAACPECEKHRKELEKSFELAFAAGQLAVKVDATEFKKTTVTEAHANNKDAYMRKSLLKMIWDDTEKELYRCPNAPPRPFPEMTAYQVRGELRRILGN